MTIQHDAKTVRIRLEGECGMAGVAELKAALVEALESGKALELDLSDASEIDLSTLQLLWAVGQAAGSGGQSFVSRAPESFGTVARCAGFESFPGMADQISWIEA